MSLRRGVTCARGARSVRTARPSAPSSSISTSSSHMSLRRANRRRALPKQSVQAPGASVPYQTSNGTFPRTAGAAAADAPQSFPKAKIIKPAPAKPAGTAAATGPAEPEKAFPKARIVKPAEPKPEAAKPEPVAPEAAKPEPEAPKADESSASKAVARRRRIIVT